MVNSKAAPDLGLNVSKAKMLDRPATSAGLSAAEPSPRRTLGRSFRGIPLGDHVQLDDRELTQWGSSYSHSFKRPNLPSSRGYGLDWSSRRGTLAVAAAAYAHPYNKLNLTLEEKAARGPDSRIMAQKEAFGSTLDLCHRPSMLERPRFTKSSAVIGSRTRYRPEYSFEDPRKAQYTNNSLNKSAMRHTKFMEEFVSKPELSARRATTAPAARATYRISYEQEYPEGNNTRYAWPRNVSQVSAELLDCELDEDGQPIREKDYGEDGDVQLPQRDQHYTTTKAAVDNITVSKAHGEGLYAHCATGGKVMRTVSADSPAWFQVPDAAVAPLTPEQLRILLEWKAPLPRRLVELEEDEASRAPLLTCPLRCTHAGCSLAREVILSGRNKPSSAYVELGASRPTTSRPVTGASRGRPPFVLTRECTPKPPSRPMSTSHRPPSVRYATRAHEVVA